jgi:hypothetical protein
MQQLGGGEPIVKPKVLWEKTNLPARINIARG